MDGYFVLLYFPPKGTYLNHAFDARQLPLDLPIVQTAQICQRIIPLVCRIYLQCVLVHFAQSCGNGHELRSSYFAGDVRLGHLDLLAYPLPCQCCLDVVVKNHRHNGESGPRDAPHFLYSGQVGHAQFHRIGNELFDFLGGQGRGGGDHLYLVVGDVGNCVQRKPKGTDQAPQGHGSGKGKNKGFLANRKANDGMQHGQ